MRRRQFLSRVVLSGGAGSVACVMSGCGSLMHSERVGQSHSHHIDWKVAALDGLGMLFFFVPGVIAFAVDFYTGAIYLPHGECCAPRAAAAGESETQVLPAAAEFPDPGTETVPGGVEPAVYAEPPRSASTRSASDPMASPLNGQPSLRRIDVPQLQLTPERLEQIVSTQVGCPVSLQNPHTRLSVLPSIDGFHTHFRRHETDRQFGFKLRQLLERVRSA